MVLKSQNSSYHTTETAIFRCRKAKFCSDVTNSSYCRNRRLSWQASEPCRGNEMCIGAVFGHQRERQTSTSVLLSPSLLASGLYYCLLLLLMASGTPYGRSLRNVQGGVARRLRPFQCSWPSKDAEQTPLSGRNLETIISSKSPPNGLSISESRYGHPHVERKLI